MRRALIILALGALAAPATAHAQSTASGGTTPEAAVTPVAAVAPAAGGSAPGGLPAGARPTVPASNAATGGNPYGRTFRIPPVIRGFSATPAAVTWGGAPTRLRFRVDATNLRSVRVVLDVRARGARSVRRIALGVQPTGRSLTRTWTRDGIDPGTYYLALRVVDARGRSLAQAASASITVRVKPTPKPAPAPAPAATPSPSPAPSGSGVFPVRGPVTWGDGFGVNRGDHLHNGQDLAAASGTPLVTPRRGTVVATGFGSGSGYYVVVKDSDRDVSYVFFHLLAGSTVVSKDQALAAGQRVGSVGATGDATGPHLHFEVWLGAWWGGGHSVDPAPYLRSWS
jgi:murein DD-endopeptidase MepM/ murein hydrolase activator NlpD